MQKETKETKYGKYIVYKTMAELNIPEPPPATPRMDYPGAQTTISLGDAVVKGSFLLRNRLFFEATDRPHEPIPHSHDTDEALTFFGTNPYDWRDLGGEVEFWIEDEKHILTQSCVIFVPKGVMHCPLWIKRVDRPIFHYAALPSISYVKEMSKDAPPKSP